MQRSHEAQQISVQEQLRKEVNMLQKKILSDTVGWIWLVFNNVLPRKDETDYRKPNTSRRLQLHIHINT